MKLRFTLMPIAVRVGRPIMVPFRWRVEQALGVLTIRNRRLVRDWEQLPETSETMMIVANLRRLVRTVARLD